MNIKFMKKAVLFILMMFMSISAYGMTVNVTSDLKTREVSVSGEALPESVISMLIYADEDGTFEVTAKNAQDSVFAGMQTKATTDGKFAEKFTFDSKENSGWYTAVVYSVAENARKNVRFYMLDDKASEEMRILFNGASWDKIYDLTKRYSQEMPVINVDIADFAAYEEETAKLIVEKRNNSEAGFSSNTEIETTINSAIAEVNLKYCEKEEVCTYIEKYANDIGIVLDKNWTEIKDEISEMFVEKRANKPEEKITSLFEEAMAISVLNNSVKSEIEAVLKMYNDIFDMDLSGYEKYDPIEISKALYDRGYTEVDDIEVDYRARIKELADSKKSSSSSGGGGGGSRGGSYVSGTVAIDTPSYIEAVEEKVLPFKDLDGFEWAKEYIKSLYALGVISGVSADSFEPEGLVKRSEISKMICNALDTEVIIGENPFADVKATAWYAEFVINAYENGFITGYEGKFNPDSNILRRDLALIVMRALKSGGTEYKEGIGFDDITEQDAYAEAAINSLAGYGIINGRGNRKFAPSEYVTRAEAAKIIYNMMKVMGHE